MKILNAIRVRARRDDGGQVLPLVAAGMLVLIACAAIVIDVGRVYGAKQQLQNAVNAAALVAGQDLATSGSASVQSTASATAVADAIKYSGAHGDDNQLGDGISANAPTITFKCDPLAPGYTPANGSNPATCNDSNCDPSGAQTPAPGTLGAGSTCNAIVITETATVHTTLAGFILHSWTITRTAIAGERGGSLVPQDVEVVVDNTQSMNDQDDCTVDNNEGTPIQSVADDPSTTPSSLDCAKAGVQTLLQTLLPCSSSLSSCSGATAVDKVGELVFPAISTSQTNLTYANAKSQETDCNSDNASDQTATTDQKFSVTYPTWKSYSYNAASALGGIPTTTTGSGNSITTDVYSGFVVNPLSNTYRAGGASTVPLTLTDPDVEAVDWGQCPARNVTTTTRTTTTQTNTSTTTVPTTLTVPTTKTVTTTQVVSNPTPPPKFLTNTITTTVPTTTTIHTTTTQTNTTTTTGPYTLTTTTPFGAGDYPGGNFYGLKAYGGAGTELAGVITEAQYQLAVASQTAAAGTKNVIVLLSDGQVNQTSSDCSNATTAATLAQDAGTTIYVIGYGDDSGSTDCSGNVSPKTLLENVATSGDYIDAPDGSTLQSAFEQAGEEIDAGNSELLSN